MRRIAIPHGMRFSQVQKDHLLMQVSPHLQELKNSHPSQAREMPRRRKRKEPKRPFLSFRSEKLWYLESLLSEMIFKLRNTLAQSQWYHSFVDELKLLDKLDSF